MAATASGWNLGFLTVLNDTNGYLGGYLVTNQWGRPLEFRLSSAIQPNRVQQILYGDTLEPYLCSDLIGKTLLDKTGSPAQLIITDRPAALDLRFRVDKPVALLAAPHGKEPSSLQPHERFPGDEAKIREMIDGLGGPFDLAEPFVRIREAIAEARKMGVTGRG